MFAWGDSNFQLKFIELLTIKLLSEWVQPKSVENHDTNKLMKFDNNIFRAFYASQSYAQR